MKHFAVTLLLLSSMDMYAQPTLSANNVQLLGRTFPMHQVLDPFTSTWSGNGMDQTWEFGGALLELNAATSTYVDPVETPYAAEHPGSNLAQVVTTTEGTTYNYYTFGGGQLAVLAEGVGGTSPVIYTDPRIILVFPLAYPYLFDDTYEVLGTEYDVTGSYAGYGTLVTAFGTYTNVVKVTRTGGHIDFYHSNPVQPLVTIVPGGPMYLWDDALMTDVGEAPGTVRLAAFPNPATDRVRISGAERIGSWSLFNAQGSAVASGQTLNAPYDLDIHALSPGTYTLLVRDAKAPRRVRIVKV
jgi:hypothetical protein